MFILHLIFLFTSIRLCFQVYTKKKFLVIVYTFKFPSNYVYTLKWIPLAHSFEDVCDEPFWILEDNF